MCFVVCGCVIVRVITDLISRRPVYYINSFVKRNNNLVVISILNYPKLVQQAGNNVKRLISNTRVR